MNEDQSNQTRAPRWRVIASAVLTFAAAGVTVLACLSGPSSATSPTPAVVSGVNEHVPANLQGALGGDVGSALVQQN
jgi:hypothetical protein